MATPQSDGGAKVGKERVCALCHAASSLLNRRSGNTVEAHTPHAGTVTVNGIPYVSMMLPLPAHPAKQVFYCARATSVRMASDKAVCAACGFACCNECMGTAALMNPAYKKVENARACSVCVQLAKSTRKVPTFETHTDESGVRYIVSVQKGDERWVPDKATALCMSNNCEYTFTGFDRHHCRSCGFLVCDTCSMRRTELWCAKTNKLLLNQRVCRHCDAEALSILPDAPPRGFTAITYGSGATRFGAAAPVSDYMNPKAYRHCSSCKQELESKYNCEACGRVYCYSCCPDTDYKDPITLCKGGSVLLHRARVCTACRVDAEALRARPSAATDRDPEAGKQWLVAATTTPLSRCDYPICMNFSCGVVLSLEAKGCITCGGIFCAECCTKRGPNVTLVVSGDVMRNVMMCGGCYMVWQSLQYANAAVRPKPRGPPADAIEKFQRDKDMPLACLPMLRRLQTFHVVIICDDSGSMNLQGRWSTMQGAVESMLEFSHVAGHTVDVYFLNRDGKLGVEHFRELRPCFSAPPKGGTNVVRVLRTVFGDRVQEDMAQGLVVYFFTDGHPTNAENKEDLNGFAAYLRARPNRGNTFFGILLLTEEEDVVQAYRSIEYGRSQGRNAIKGVDVTLSWPCEEREVDELARRRGSYYRLTRGDYLAKCLLGCIDTRIHNIDLEVETES
jgi:hypothetical protein